MKIEKYNESYQGDKLIKRYNNSILHEYDVEHEKVMLKLKNEKLEIIKLINEFITLNKGKFSNNYSLYPNIADYYFFIDTGNKPTLELYTKYNDDDSIYLTYNDMNKLFDFLDNPELYRNVNKYNL